MRRPMLPRAAALLSCLLLPCLLAACAAPAAPLPAARDGYFELILPPPEALSDGGLRVTAIAAYTGQGTGGQSRGEVDVDWGYGEAFEAARASAAPTWPPSKRQPYAQPVRYGDFGEATPFLFAILDEEGDLIAQGPGQRGIFALEQTLAPGQTLIGRAGFDPLPPGNYRLRAALAYRLPEAARQSPGTRPPYDVYYLIAELPFSLPGPQPGGAPSYQDRAFALTLPAPEVRPDGSVLLTAQAAYTGWGVALPEAASAWPPTAQAPSAQWLDYGDFGEATPFLFAILDEGGDLVAQGPGQQGVFERYRQLAPGDVLAGRASFDPLPPGRYRLRAVLAYRLPARVHMQAPFNTFHLTVETPFAVP